MSRTSIAKALGISRKTLYGILNEKQPVTAGMAVRFGKLFGNGAGFWANLQCIHDLAVAERTVDVSGIPTLEARAGQGEPPRAEKGSVGFRESAAMIAVFFAASACPLAVSGTSIFSYSPKRCSTRSRSDVKPLRR